MKFRFSTILALVAAGVALSATTVRAAIVGGLNQIQFSDREQLATYNSATHTYTATTTPIIGAHLYGTLASTVESPNPGPPNATGVFDLVVAKIVAGPNISGVAQGTSIVDGSGHILAGFTGIAEVLLTSDSAVLSGGQTGGFLTGSTGTTYTLADGSTIKGLGQVANTLDAAYQGTKLTTANPPGSNLDTLGNQANTITAATVQPNGVTPASFFGDFGLGATLTDTSSSSSWGASGVGYWTADVQVAGGLSTGGTVPFVLGLVPLTVPSSAFVPLYNELVPLQKGGEYSGLDGTSIYQNAGIDPHTPDLTAGSPLAGGVGPFPNPTQTTFALVGGGHANVNSLPSPWPTTSADPYWMEPAPEPGTMLLMGMGLAFSAYVRRRRKANA